METRLRLALIRAGLPRPLTQYEVSDPSGAFVARIDLFYEDARLAIEFDGGVHREHLTADNQRQNRILALGINLLRFTGADLRERRAQVIEQVRAARVAGIAQRGRPAAA